MKSIILDQNDLDYCVKFIDGSGSSPDCSDGSGYGAGYGAGPDCCDGSGYGAGYGDGDGLGDGAGAGAGAGWGKNNGARRC